MLILTWDGERSPSELAASCQLSRPATSQHLKVLRDTGLVSARLEGNRRLYRVRADRLAEVRAMLDEFWGSRLASLQSAPCNVSAERKAAHEPESTVAVDVVTEIVIARPADAVTAYAAVR
jgi:predicted transcriptional regulator